MTYTPSTNSSNFVPVPAPKKNHGPCLKPQWIDHHALGIVKTLQKNGYIGYLVGGCVRDLLVGKSPKDFDIATSAKPNQIKKVIRQAYIIGRRFRLVLVKREGQQFEVATFRGKNPEPNEETSENGKIIDDNYFGTSQEDSQRRDFTVNALFYDPVKNKIEDHVDGLADIELKLIRMVGDPELRLIEDPIRMLRAVRLSHKLGFTIEASLRSSIIKHADHLQNSVLPRKREEILKFLALPFPELTFVECYDLGLLKLLLPSLNSLFNEDQADLFLGYLRFYKQYFYDQKDTILLYSLFMLSFLQARFPEEDVFTNPKKMLEDPALNFFMREELGMFKYEQFAVVRAISYIKSLYKIERFKNKSYEKKMNILKVEAFPISLLLADIHFLLPPEDIKFWKKIYSDNFSYLLKQYQAKKASEKKVYYRGKKN